MATFCHETYIFGLHLLETILKVKAEYIDFMTKSSYFPSTL